MKRILIIEDSADLRRPIAETLRLEGYSVVEAENGVDGMALLRDHQIDMIISDIMMPEMNGYEVLRQVRSQPETVDMPFVFLTAKTEARDIRKGMQLTADDYLTKPVKTEDMLQCIEAQITRARIKRTAMENRLLGLKEDITHMLPHEMMTPLTAILALSEYMGDDVAIEPAMVRELANDIHVSGMRLLRMIRNYLTYSELSLLLAQDEPAIAAFELEECDVEEHLVNWAHQNAERWSRSDDLVVIMGKGSFPVKYVYLEQVLGHLLDNAFKFSDQGQKVRLEITLTGDEVKLVVMDKGRGMSREMIQDIQLFRQFERKHYEQQGSGLGLPIVLQIVKLLNGSLAIDSEPKQGTHACVRFPLNPQHWYVKVID